ncbi:MAG TPA: argininosuccinate lyase, partial [Saccharofermentans sp.]|nr:argininosuccinate lyase [Saccharofermentans sp.]
VHYCIENNTTLEKLSLDEYKQFSEAFDNDVFDAISLKTCVEKRLVTGAPSPMQVKLYLESL